MPTTPKKKFEGFSEDELLAMRARAKELAAEARSNKSKAEGEKVALAAIAEMPEPDRAMATRLHKLIKENAPTLSAKTWYSMPAYTKDDKVVCFFQSAKKFKARYSTLGFNDTANLDDGEMWPTSFALKEITSATEKKIISLLKQAIS